jgi:hypothetical protein
MKPKTLSKKKPLEDSGVLLTEVEQVEPPVNPLEYGVSTEMANDLMADLPTIKSQRQELIREYDAVMALDPDDSETAVRARELRIAFQKNRTQRILKWHERAKEVFLRGGQFVDAIKRKEISVNETHEFELQKIERRQEILEAERKEKIRQSRLLVLNELESPEVHGLADMTDEAFETYVMGIRARKAQEEQERILREEQERKAKLHTERYVRLSKYADFIERFDDLNFGDMDEAEFIRIGTDAKAKKDARDAEQERIRLENEAIKAQQEAQKENNAKRLQVLIQYSEFVSNYTELLDLSDEDFASQLNLIVTKAELKREQDRHEEVEREKARAAEIDAHLEAEREKARIAQMEADALRKQQEEQEKANEEAERNARKEQENYEIELLNKKMALAEKDSQTKLLIWISNFSLPEEMPGGEYTPYAQHVITEIKKKHQLFINWATQQAKNDNPVNQ